MTTFTSIKEYHTCLTQNAFNCSEVVAAYLNKIEKKKQLNAFTEVFAQEALQKANELDDKRKMELL